MALPAISKTRRSIELFAKFKNSSDVRVHCSNQVHHTHQLITPLCPLCYSRFLTYPLMNSLRRLKKPAASNVIIGLRRESPPYFLCHC